ncbi:hypothetical protein OHA01_01915 [Micromonospora zamorensis]|nr:hypothetical protein OHA01_01915 [Micromonospora zamorensis]
MTTDRWAQWLLARRDGGDATLRARYASDLAWFATASSTGPS